jgi:hypothetical protein
MTQESPIGNKELGEKELLVALRDLQGILAAGLNSLAGKMENSPEAKYLVWGATHVNKIADAFILLREASRIHASKVLVRPVIETSFFVGAVVKRRGAVYWKARSEAEEDKKFTSVDPKQIEKDLEDFKQGLRAWDPNYPIQERNINAWEAADMIGLSVMYQTGYRTYCQFTHGALRAVLGALDEFTDPIDTRVMCWCVLLVAGLLREHAGATVPDLTTHWSITTPTQNG